MRFTHLCRAAIDHEQFHSQGIFPDGWAAETMHWMLPACYATATIRGALPAWAKPLEQQRLRVYVNGRLRAERQPGYGEFSIPVRLQWGPEPLPAVLRIECETAVIPAQEGLGPDHRRLAWQILGFDRAR
jgi:hypothetical protein